MKIENDPFFVLSEKKSVFCRIKIQGDLHSSYSLLLAGMRISVERSENQLSMTRIEGHLADQAILDTILDTLYELHAPIIEVECIRSPKVK